MSQTRIASTEGWPVLNWLVHINSSSCKGISGLQGTCGLCASVIFADDA